MRLLTVLMILFCLSLPLAAQNQIMITDSRQEWIKHTYVPVLQPSTWGEYAEGDLFIRYQVYDKPSSIEIMPMICLWQGTYGTPEFCETCTKMGALVKFSDEGAYFQKFNGPAAVTNWQNPYGTGYKKSEPTDRIMHQWWVKKDGRTVVLRASTGESYDYGDGVEEHIPIDFKSTMILVKPGQTFVPPADWIGCPSGWGCATSIQQTPYLRQQWSFPGRVEAEDYDEGGEGIAYHDETGDNKYDLYRYDDVDIRASEDAGGGYKVNISGAEWLEYTADVTAGTYDISLRVSNARTGTNRAVVKLDGVTLGSVDIPATGGATVFETVVIPGVTVGGGDDKILRIEMEGDSWYLNWIEMAEPGTVGSIGMESGTRVRPEAPAYFDCRGRMVRGVPEVPGVYVRVSGESVVKVMVSE